MVQVQMIGDVLSRRGFVMAALVAALHFYGCRTRRGWPEQVRP
jgi:hypothetical protein